MADEASSLIFQNIADFRKYWADLLQELRRIAAENSRVLELPMGTAVNQNLFKTWSNETIKVLLASFGRK